MEEPGREGRKKESTHHDRRGVEHTIVGDVGGVVDIDDLRLDSGLVPVLRRHVISIDSVFVESDSPVACRTLIPTGRRLKTGMILKSREAAPELA
jgi:hypothetical protein